MCGGGSTERFIDKTFDAYLNVVSGGGVGYKDGKFGTGAFQKNVEGTDRGTKLEFSTLPGSGIYKDLSGVTAK